MTDLEIVRHYKTICSCEQFVLTGSTALKHMGLIDKSSDIDIILVNPTSDTLDMLKKLQEANPARTAPKEGSEVKFIFLHENTKIDFFIQSEKIDSQIYIVVSQIKVADSKDYGEAVQLNKLSNIIAAKKKFNRLKDLVQLRYLSRLFFKEEDLSAKLNGSSYIYSVDQY